MGKTNVRIVSINDLVYDERNANKGTKRGREMLERSLKDLGAGRSIVVDRNNRIIAGSHEISSVWELPYDDGASRSVGKAHPTQKPLELFAIPIRKHTVEGDLLLETFSGSGTQLCVAEALKRRCFAMEIEPAFVAVALERLSEMGLKPTLAKQEKRHAR